MLHIADALTRAPRGGARPGVLDSSRRMRSLALAVAGVTVVWLATGPAAFAAAHGGAGRITLSGKVGPLQLDRSTRADVISFAGRPDETATGNFHASPASPGYRALAYRCRPGNPVVSCQTVFFMNARTRRLVGFTTTSRRYSFRGARTGMTTAAAGRRMRERPVFGCLSGFQLFSTRTRASLVGTVSGGRLTTLSVESNRDPVGVLFC